jgi:hypothetical protein
MERPKEDASNFHPSTRCDHFPAMGVPTAPTRYTVNKAPKAEGPREKGGAARWKVT